MKLKTKAHAKSKVHTKARQEPDTYEEGNWRLVLQPGLGETDFLRGLLEYNHNGEWGTICNDAFDYNTNGAQVACQTLGLPWTEADYYTDYGENPVPSGTPIWLDQVTCDGSESRLDDCPMNPVGQHDCSHWEDVGVVCSGENPGSERAEEDNEEASADAYAEPTDNYGGYDSYAEPAEEESAEAYEEPADNYGGYDSYDTYGGYDDNYGGYDNATSSYDTYDSYEPYYEPYGEYETADEGYGYEEANSEEFER